ncbi:fungal pheromone mating factor STE2 GPCR-domain-containing protein [Limtongia smithiae]|uniref:fungal pheromone mating factor STE2 GPCR-domain-containing protein n=1 Tax=Limtongia smithiae TaxID=1125753 RepID=UPI0034CFA621
MTGFPSGETPSHQTITYIIFDGSSYNVSTDTINSWMIDNSINCAVFGVHIGACTVAAIALALLTKPSKRRTPVFALNMASLFLAALRAGLWITYSIGPLNQFGAYFAAYETDIGYQEFVEAAVTSALQLVIAISIELSLIFQVRVVFDSSRVLKRNVTLACSSLALLVAAFWLVAVVENIKTIFVFDYYSQISWTWVVARILYIASITTFCAIFSYKLYRAIRQRRVLGLVEFGPLQVIVIMSTQTMIIPLVLTIIQLVADVSAPLTSMGTLFVVLSLPLSTLWASATNDLIIASRRANGSTDSSTGTASTNSLFKSNPTDTSTTMNSDYSNLDLEKSMSSHWKGSGNVTVTRTVITE